MFALARVLREMKKKEKEKEEEEEEGEEEEEEAINHLSHEHPLILVEARSGDYCHGCRMYFSGEEHAYGCSKRCGYTRLLHEECAALPRRVTHAMHPQHILIQQRFQHLSRCAICESYIWSIGYRCESGECEFQMHIRCAQGSSVMGTAGEDVAVVTMKHESHPEHELWLREDSFGCDACGTTRMGASYICNAVCRYWIHHRCATLPQTMERKDHHHSLSLSYYVPPQYIKSGSKCGVCYQYLLGKYWIYHCELCKYGVHVKCAFTGLPRRATITNVDDEGSESGVDEAYLNHWSHEHLLTLVVSGKAVRCLSCRGSIKKGERAYGCAKTCEYPHLLHVECAEMPRRISHPMHPQHELERKYIVYFPPCEICRRPVVRENGYKCERAECDIRMHLRCALDSNAMYNDKRPPIIQHPSHPHHDLRLWRRWSSKCDACAAPPRGRSYICTVCEYRVHERCASLPATMKTEGHRHGLSLLFRVPLEYIKFRYKCDVCHKDLLAGFWKYLCRLCGYAVHLKCAFKTMPRATVRNADDDDVEEEKTVVSNIHYHPLTLAETRRGGECHDCERLLTSGGLAYVCSKKCGYQGLLHEECGEMTIKIRHPLHPQHILVRGYSSRCAICRKREKLIGYHCTSLDCEFQIHTRCILDNNDELGRATLHQSHPQHELRLLKRICSFRCDACGIKRTGKSYVCTSCEYWVHHSCASLPETFKREDHDHALSLSFCVPLEYIEFDFKCEVCRKDLLGRFWIYHCRLCRYAVHISCIFKKRATRVIDDDEEGIIRFPVENVAEEQIRPFVMMRGEAIAPVPDHAIHEFYKDKHEMRLVSSSHGDQNEEENSDNEDDYGQISKLMCDGCATPIHQKQSSSSKSKYYYTSCSDGEYLLHPACYLLPPRLSSIPLHNQPDHELVLQTCAKLELDKDCSFCKHPMNGLFYSCRACEFKADIKCSTVPDAMLHAAHPHILKLVSSKEFRSPRSCAALCNASRLDSDDYWYICKSCKEEEEFSVHVSCATLPRSIWSLKWDKQHALLLTFDANLNHPGEFYCDECEEQMNPKRWMYHCRDCDLSFHPHCFKATPGEYRNIKFGGRVNAVAHPQHPLTYQLLTAKCRCNICGEDRYERRGFHCAYCNFFICFGPDCGVKMIRDGDIRVAD